MAKSWFDKLVTSKTFKKVIATFTITVGGWYIFKFSTNLLDPYLTTAGSWFVVGTVLVFIGIKFFKLKGLDY